MTIKKIPVIYLSIIGLLMPLPLAAGGTGELTESQAGARELLMDMGQFLSETQRFSVNINGGYEAVQESGQKIEFNSNRKILISRPNHLRVEGEKSSGDKSLTLIDDKNITYSNLTQNVYAQTPHPGNLDSAIKYLISDLHIRLPLAALLLSQLPEELETRVAEVDYVEDTSIFGVPAHHLAGSTDTVDFQIWITDDENPLPIRIILSYKFEEGQPRFWAEFTDWNLSPKVSESSFTFTPPEGARKIEFLAQLSKQGVKPAPAAAPAGEQP
jgi:hypothetical protein